MLTMNETAINDVYMFIAELNGYKIGTVDGKLAFGKSCYSDDVYPEMCDDDLYEIIWLERLYKELDSMFEYKLTHNTFEGFHWSVPIELDATASMLGFMGALLGDRRMLEMVNAAGDPNVLMDAWSIDGLSRNHVKKVATPRLYGSSQPAHDLWKKADLEYTLEDVLHMNKALREGPFAAADAFKEFIINHCNPQETMQIVIDDDEFEIKCNHYRHIGDVHVKYDLFDTESGRIKRVVHTKTKMIPDLDRFRSYFVTLLIHNRDGSIADKVSGKTYDKYGFCLDIHDAFIVHPVAANDVRTWYAEALTDLFRNRKEILNNYFKSIGINATSAAAWNEVMSLVDPIDENFECRVNVLK